MDYHIIKIGINLLRLKKSLLVMIYLSEYKSPIALFEKNNRYTPKIPINTEVKICEEKYHEIAKTAITLIIITILIVNMVTNTFSKPIAFISLIVPTIFKALSNFPVFASLHSAMVVARKNIIEINTPKRGTIHNCNINPKKKDIIDGSMKYTIFTTSIFLELDNCLEMLKLGVWSLF